MRRHLALVRADPARSDALDRDGFPRLGSGGDGCDRRRRLAPGLLECRPTPHCGPGRRCWLRLPRRRSYGRRSGASSRGLIGSGDVARWFWFVEAAALTVMALVVMWSRVQVRRTRVAAYPPRRRSPPKLPRRVEDVARPDTRRRHVGDRLPRRRRPVRRRRRSAHRPPPSRTAGATTPIVRDAETAAVRAASARSPRRCRTRRGRRRAPAACTRQRTAASGASCPEGELRASRSGSSPPPTPNGDDSNATSTTARAAATDRVVDRGADARSQIGAMADATPAARRSDRRAATGRRRVPRHRPRSAPRRPRRRRVGGGDRRPHRTLTSRRFVSLGVPEDRLPAHRRARRLSHRRRGGEDGTGARRYHCHARPPRPRRRRRRRCPTRCSTCKTASGRSTAGSP